MKARGLINCFVMLLWLVAMHHCVIEQLFGKFHQRQAYSNSNPTSSDKTGPIDCPAHSSDDSSSHSEGKACSSVFQLTSSSRLQDVTKVVFTPIDIHFFLELSDIIGNLFPFLSTISSKNTNLVALSLLTNSLSIAPNAPPAMLV